MKRKYILILWLSVNVILAIALETSGPVKTTDAANPWKKAKNNSWPGVVDEKAYPFRLDQNARLWWKPDGNRWIPDEDSMWTDIEGSFFKIDSLKLVWSPDGGNSWFDAKERQWLAADSNWYRLDQNWVVWMKRTQPGM